MAIGSWRRLLTPRSVAATAPSIPSGQRVYAIGDIHGRDDLFTRMVDGIEADDRGRSGAETTIILLGDLVDRGPGSAAVIDRVMRWGERRRVRIVTGNHEEMFLAALDDPLAMRHFLRVGGRETILSYGVDADTLDAATLGEALALARAAVPERHRAFLADGESLVRIGDYLFTHAGIRPGIGLDAQVDEDLRWIREPFLRSEAVHGAVVVHGHTIGEEVVLRRNRIGIDTGAYRTGRLTALRLEGDARTLIEARANGISQRAI